MEFSIIIPVTRKDLLNKCLQSLEQMDFQMYEVILIVDKKFKCDSKLNITQIEVEDKSPSVRRNIGVKKAKAPYIAFIDDDVIVNKKWLSNAKEIFENYPKIAGIGGPDYIPPNSSFSEKITDALLSHKYFGSGVLAHTYYKKPKIINHPSAIATCNMIMKKEIFDKIGFNEKLRYGGGEDTELIYILQKKFKAKFLYHPSIYVYHKKREFGLAYFKQRLKFRISNGKMMYIYPKLYLANKKFLLFVLGITFGIALLFIKPLIFLLLFILYFFILTITSLSFIKKDVKIFLLLPLLLFVQHGVYYLGIVIGLLYFCKYRKLKEIRR